METWSVDQVCKWLVKKKLGELVPRFQEEEVSGAALLALNDRMIQQLVKKIGHQAVLMDFIKKYKQCNQWLKPTGDPRETSLLTLAQAAPEHEENCSPTSYGDQTSLHPAENLDNGLIDQRVLKQRRNIKHVLARHKAIQWTKSYVLPEFPYDVKCMLAEQKCPDHSMRIRIIEFLQADMTKYLEGSLYPTTQQYNDVVNALLQAHPFLDEDGCSFFLWKRALKDRFKYVQRPIEDDEQVLRNKCKFGHRRGKTRKSLADIRSDEIKIVQIKGRGQNLGSGLGARRHWFQQEYKKTDKDWREIDERMNQTLEIRRKMTGCGTPLKMLPFLKCPYQMFREVQLLTRTDIYPKTSTGVTDMPGFYRGAVDSNSVSHDIITNTLAMEAALSSQSYDIFNDVAIVIVVCSRADQAQGLANTSDVHNNLINQAPDQHLLEWNHTILWCLLL
ncbi:sterile alpha motif domain-containing protein 3 [Sigmodon hispidus]